jgi:cytochrome c5
MTVRRNFAARFALIGALTLAIAACSNAEGDAPTAEAKPAPPMPQSQVVMFGATSADEGERLYGRECAFCHAGNNTGTIMLGRRMEKAKAELHKRDDLDADYVKTVVRNGLVNMPPFSRVELTDEELDKLAGWLARQGSPQ